MHKSKKTADYDVIHEEGGNRYRFFCDISGALLCTTEPFSADTTEAELMLAWKSMGVEHFNLCHKCGKWVMDAGRLADIIL